MKFLHLTVLALAGLLAVAGSSQAGDLFGKKRTVDVAFDSYCDGMYLKMNFNKGTVTGNRTGCASDLIFGTVQAINSKKGGGSSVSVTVDGLGVVYVILDNNKWTIYNAAGVLNSGTYSKGVPAGAGPKGQPSSTD